MLSLETSRVAQTGTDRFYTRLDTLAHPKKEGFYVFFKSLAVMSTIQYFGVRVLK